MAGGLQGTSTQTSFALLEVTAKRNASGLEPRGDLIEEVRPMRLIRVEWGKFKLELPADILVFLLLRAFLMFHNMNV